MLQVVAQVLIFTPTVLVFLFLRVHSSISQSAQEAQEDIIVEPRLLRQRQMVVIHLSNPVVSIIRAYASRVVVQVAVMAPLVLQIARFDVALATQLRRSGASVALNLAEGHGSRGGNKRLRYENALGSLREVWASLESAEALEYIDAHDGVMDALDRVAAGQIGRAHV